MRWLAKHHFDHELRRLQAVLGLRDWTIKYTWDIPDDSDNWGEAQPVGGQMHANLAFHDSLLSAPWPAQQRVILHELLHVVHQDIVEHVEVQLSQLPKPVAKALRASFRTREERFVDQMSRLLLPLI